MVSPLFMTNFTMFKFGILNIRRPFSWSTVQYYMQRHLSVNETATALRPFYFAVHPDLFGQHPKERAINEDSIKRLNEYIDKLHTNQQVPPAYLRFYLRSLANNGEEHAALRTFREVGISLRSNNVKETVASVLRSCDISLNYINSIKGCGGSHFNNTSDRPIRWDKSYYDFYGIPNPYSAKSAVRPDLTLSSWLHRNVVSAKTKQAATKPVKEQTDRIIAQLKEEMGVTDIRWISRWGLPQFRSCLFSLARLYEQNITDIDTRGRALVFGAEMGISLYGDIMLRCDDVPSNWLKFLKQYKSHDSVLSALPVAEQELSRVLNNARIIRHSHHRGVPAKHYLKELQRLIISIKRSLHEDPSTNLLTDLSDVQIVVECAQGPLMVSDEGLVQIPSFTPGFSVLDFLNQNADLIRSPKRYNRYGKKCSLVEEVEEEYNLLSLTRDINITKAQLKTCCLHLLEDPRNIGVDLEGCRIRVTMFYSVMNDGQICIPWNWKGAYDPVS